MKTIKKMIVPILMLGLIFIYSTGTAVAMAEPSKEVDLTINNKSKTIETNANTIGDMLISVDYEHKDTDKINYELTDRVVNEMAVVVSSEKEVNLSIKGDDFSTKTNASTVADLLKELEIEVSKDDIVIPSLESNLNDLDNVMVIHYEKEVNKDTTAIDYKSSKELSFDVLYGETEVAIEGVPGALETTVEKVSKNGIIVSDEIVLENTIRKPTDEKILVGTKEIVNKEIDNKTITKDNDSMYKGETKVTQEGEKGNKQFIYKNDGENRELVSEEITKKPVDRIVEKGTKVKPKAQPVVKSSSATYSLSEFQHRGVINSGGKKYTYYSQSVLPGGGLKIPGRHVNAGGYVSDGDGYIVLATSISIPKGTVINTPFGYQGKVYDTCAACHSSWYDVYTK